MLVSIFGCPSACSRAASWGRVQRQEYRTRTGDLWAVRAGSAMATAPATARLSRVWAKRMHGGRTARTRGIHLARMFLFRELLICVASVKHRRRPAPGAKARIGLGP